jgi:(E)-4-hydroxy-3-methylbut-2-enyl-diphosphate synthase
MIKVGSLILDGKKIYVQSMLNKLSSDIDGNVAQALELEAAGADIIRVSVPTMGDCALITAIKNAVAIPLVADIHFNADIAVRCAEMGVDKIRINPGNIGSEDNIKKVAAACKSRNIPIRIGVNSGSIPKKIRAKYTDLKAANGGLSVGTNGGLSSGTDGVLPVGTSGGRSDGTSGGRSVGQSRLLIPPEAFAEAAAENIKALEREDFHDIVVSVKSSDVKTMINANRLIAARYDYPLHLGVTEAGTYHTGLIKSAAGIGSLLVDGIGATIRVSLSDDPVREVKAGRDLLKALGLAGGVRVISCPTCGRTRIDVIGTARELETLTADIKKDLTVAVMGCVVNGPGEAKGANIAVAGASDNDNNPYAMLYIDGEPIRKIAANQILDVLLEEIEKYKPC